MSGRDKCKSAKLSTPRMLHPVHDFALFFAQINDTCSSCKCHSPKKVLPGKVFILMDLQRLLPHHLLQMDLDLV